MPADTRSAWTEAGAFSVAPGVHRVPLPLPMDGLRAVNVYVIEDDDGLVMIDGGWALEQSRNLLSAALGTLGYQLSDIRRFLVTHLHRDHYTQAVTLRREVGARVSLGIGEKPAIDLLLTDDPLRRFEPQMVALRASGADALIDRLQRSEVMDGPPEAWESPDDWLEKGTQIPLRGRTLLAVPTPGHTQGHVVFADPDAGLLFAGDHVLPHITPSIGFEPVTAELPLRDYLDSLRLVLDLPDMQLLPAHGPVTDSAHGRVKELLDHHDERLDKCLAAVASGATTAHEVASLLGWTRHERRLASLDDFNQMLAVVETHAHLELLAATGRLGSTAGHGPTIYSTPAGGSGA
ncbi:MAG TPA: MBL fold metallo-hydrolase [Blastococcus sp.]|jgi:glyoxylase-like metal-dependent hydrolase (beta-lactamase superfamily II)